MYPFLLKNWPRDETLLFNSAGANLFGFVAASERAVYFGEPTVFGRTDVAEVERRTWSEVARITIASPWYLLFQGTAGITIAFADGTSIFFSAISPTRWEGFGRTFGVTVIRNEGWRDSAKWFRARQVLGLLTALLIFVLASAAAATWVLGYG